MQLLRTCSSGPFHPFAGDDFGSDGLGSFTICSWHSYEPMSSVMHPARCGAWGHSVPSAAWLWGQALLIATLTLSPQPHSTVLDQEVPSLTLPLWDLHTGQLSPPGMGLKP